MTTPFPPDEQHREIIYPINPEFFEDSPVDQGRDTEPPATMAAVPEHREPPKPLTTGSGINSRYRRRTTRQDSAENSSGVTTTRKETLLHHSYRSGKYAPAQGDIHINQTPEQNTNHRSKVRGEPLNSPRKDGRRCANIRGCNPRRAPPRPRPTRQHASTIVEPETATPDTPTLPTTRRFTKATPRAGAADPKRSARVHMWPHSRPGPHVHLVRFLREAFQLRSFTILSLICGFRTDSVRRLATLPPILCRHDTGGSTR